MCHPENAGTNLTPASLHRPFTPVALRGGSHVHVCSGDGQVVSVSRTEDHVLGQPHAKLPAMNSNEPTARRRLSTAGPVRVPQDPSTQPEGDFQL